MLDFGVVSVQTVPGLGLSDWECARCGSGPGSVPGVAVVPVVYPVVVPNPVIDQTRLLTSGGY